MSEKGKFELSYPIGKFQWPESAGASERGAFIETIAAAPAKLRAAVAGLNDAQLDTPYRPGGWTVRQTIHHVADSHMNSYLRMKFAVTEKDPLIKAYDEAVWAKLEDAATMPLEPSLALIEGLHARWVVFLRSLSESEWHKAFVHPEHGQMPLDRATAMYAWHSKHHEAHITGLRQREGW
jgi:hypothetical protein